MKQNFPYKKVLIVGCGGAGKSTLAVCMGKRFSLPVVHLDKLWWLPGWVERDRGEFGALLKDELEKPAWVIEGNFKRTFAQRLAYADLCIFLDYDTALCAESVRMRVKTYEGRTRPDMTEGCPEQADAEFMDWVVTFKESVRPFMIETLEKSGTPCKIFTTREETAAWLDSFESV